VDIFGSVIEIIDLRSFSNLWFWILLALVWSAASHRVIGVPYDLVLRAQRDGGNAMEDLRDLVRANANRLNYIAAMGGLAVTALAAFALTGLLSLGLAYGVEFAQAAFLLLAPLTLVWWLGVRLSGRIRDTGLIEYGAEERLFKAMRKHRIIVQAIGMLSILTTTMWGMYQNYQISVL
jgi:hypothetical protein